MSCSQPALPERRPESSDYSHQPSNSQYSVSLIHSVRSVQHITPCVPLFTVQIFGVWWFWCTKMIESVAKIHITQVSLFQRRMSSDISPSLVNWMTSMMTMRLQVILEHIPITQEQIQNYIVPTQVMDQRNRI